MKLVRESISFERGSDPKKALGIGEENLPFDIWKELLFEEFIRILMDEGHRQAAIETLLGLAELYEWDRTTYEKKMKPIDAANFINKAIKKFIK